MPFHGALQCPTCNVPQQFLNMYAILVQLPHCSASHAQIACASCLCADLGCQFTQATCLTSHCQPIQLQALRGRSQRRHTLERSVTLPPPLHLSDVLCLVLFAVHIQSVCVCKAYGGACEQ